MSFQPSQPGCAGLGASREPVIPIRAMFDSSCPRLSRASTSRVTNGIKDMDGRDKPGHDEGEASSVIKVGIRPSDFKFRFGRTADRPCASGLPPSSEAALRRTVPVSRLLGPQSFESKEKDVSLY